MLGQPPCSREFWINEIRGNGYAEHIRTELISNNVKQLLG